MSKLLLLISCAFAFILPRVAAANAVYNGGFESGDFTGWILSGNPIPGDVDSSHPHSGTYAAALFAAGSAGYLEQFLSTTPGVSYTLTYFLNSDGGTPNSFSAEVDDLTLTQQTNIPGQDYTHYSFSFQATGTSTDLKFGFQDDPGTLLLDDVSVTAAPEPVSIWLGALLVGTAVAQRKAKSTKDSI